MLQMIVHLIFHVEDDPLGDPGIDIALEDRDHLGGRQRDKGQDQQPDQQRHVLSHQRFVHDPPDDDARQQTEHGRNQDRHEHQHKLKPVRQQIGQDSPDQRSVHLGHILFFFFGKEPPRSQTARRVCHRIAAFLVRTVPAIVFLTFLNKQHHFMEDIHPRQVRNDEFSRNLSDFCCI